jgi:hypothetical protein
MTSWRLFCSLDLSSLLRCVVFGDTRSEGMAKCSWLKYQGESYVGLESCNDLALVCGVVVKCYIIWLFAQMDSHTALEKLVSSFPFPKCVSHPSSP